MSPYGTDCRFTYKVSTRLSLSAWKSFIIYGKLLPMNTKWEIEKIIYLAALIDGEGSISIEIQSKSVRHSRKIDYYSLRLLVINTCKKLMDWLQQSFGGNVRTRKKIEGRKTCYVWSIFSHNAAELLTTCKPYMIIKKNHALIFEEFASTMSRAHWRVPKEVMEKRKELYHKMKHTNKNY